MSKLLLFVLLPLLLLIGAGGGAFLAGMLPGFGADEPEMTAERRAEQKAEMERLANIAPAASEPSPPLAVFHTLDEFVVNLRSNQGYPVFLQLSLTVELSGPVAISDVVVQEPRIRDAMIVFLSSLTPEDLNGYDGVQKVRNNAWRILRDLVPPESIVNVQVAKLTVK